MTAGVRCDEWSLTCRGEMDRVRAIVQTWLEDEESQKGGDGHLMMLQPGLHQGGSRQKDAGQAGIPQE